MTDGRGEFIMTEEGQNLYEEIANGASGFATVQSLSPTETGGGRFDLMYTYDGGGAWPAADWEQRVLVRSQHVYGKGRRIRDLKIDASDDYHCPVSMIPNTGMCEAWIRIRAITTEFDTESVTWDWAYTQGLLGLSEPRANYLLATGSAVVEASGLPARRDTPLGEWNELEAIYGFELRVEAVGNARTWMQVRWQAGRDGLNWPVAYAILA